MYLTNDMLSEMTSCHQNVTTNIKFSYIESQIISIFREYKYFSEKFYFYRIK